jgi:hypothetical protein
MKKSWAFLALTLGFFCAHDTRTAAQDSVLMATSGMKPAAPSASKSSKSSTEEVPLVRPEVPVQPVNCGDALSEALDAQPTTLPCWSNIRAVERWNTTAVPDGNGKYATGFHLSENQPANLSIVLGSLVGTDLTSNPGPHGYGGLAGVAGLIDHAHWQLMFEDAGGGADLSIASENNPAGINRAAVRAVGEFNSRLLWQASIANTYGTDALRLFAPLDYRRVGDAEAVVADTAAYGLHEGRVTDEEEDAKLRYESSRRSNWDFAFGHTLQSYSDDGALIQTERGRVEFLHALSSNAAVGVYGSAERQDGESPCSLAGSGLRFLSNWKSRTTFSISGTVNGASRPCGNNAILTGDIALSVIAVKRYSVFVGANRGLSGGVLEHSTLLNAITAGVHHQFKPGLEVTLSGSGVRASDPIRQGTYSGTFEALAVSYPLGSRFVQEASIRHFQISPASLRDNRIIFAYTLWFNPRRASHSQ